MLALDHLQETLTLGVGGQHCIVKSVDTNDGEVFFLLFFGYFLFFLGGDPICRIGLQVRDELKQTAQLCPASKNVINDLVRMPQGAQNVEE